MKNSNFLLRVVLIGAAMVLAACERPSPTSVQHGYRGTGMVQVYNDRILDERTMANEIPVSLPAASADGPKAGQAYQNGQVLGNLSVAQFNRLMVSMTSWVAPEQGCTYCHNPANFAADDKYTKVVARRMVQMTQHVNADWKPHVADTGVTCYTCHRGKPVPEQIWFKEEPQNLRADFIGDRAGQNIAAASVGSASLPSDPFTPYSPTNLDIRVNGPKPLPCENRHSIKPPEATYRLMAPLSTSLGVNSTYCHNPPALPRWENSTPHRPPITRATFEAPGLPDPAVVMSMPFDRATITALGNVPSRYAIGTSPHCIGATVGVLVAGSVFGDGHRWRLYTSPSPPD